MAIKKIPIEIIIFMNIIFLSWFAFNYNTTAVVGYGILLVGQVFLYFYDRNKTFVIERKPNRLKSIALALGGLFAFFIISNGVLQLLNYSGILTNLGKALGFNSVIELYAETIPFYAQNKIVTWLAFAITFANLETDLFFGSGMEFFKDMFHLKLDLKSPKTWGFFGMLAGGFILFHITAKALGTGATAALISVGLFALVQLAVVMIEGQTLGANLMHVFANTLALLVTFAILPNITWAFMVIGAIAIIFLLVTKQINIIGSKAVVT